MEEVFTEEGKSQWSEGKTWSKQTEKNTLRNSFIIKTVKSITNWEPEKRAWESSFWKGASGSKCLIAFPAKNQLARAVSDRKRLANRSDWERKRRTRKCLGVKRAQPDATQLLAREKYQSVPVPLKRGKSQAKHACSEICSTWNRL